MSDIDEPEVDEVATDADAERELTPDEQARARRTKRLWIGAAAAAVLAAALSIGVLASLLFGAGDSKVANDVLACISNRDFTNGAKKTCPPKSGGDTGVTRIDGLVREATNSRIDFITIDRRRDEFVVRPADAPYLDIPHQQQHAALGQPTTLYWRTYKGDRIVVYMKDSDLNFQGVEGAEQ